MIEGPARSGESASSTSPEPSDEHGTGHSAADFSALVDETEGRVVAEREAGGRAGNAVERIAMPRTEPDHQASD